MQDASIVWLLMKITFRENKIYFHEKKNRFLDFSWEKRGIWRFCFSNLTYFSILNIFSSKKINLVTSGSDFFSNRKWTSGLNHQVIYQSNCFSSLKRNQYSSWWRMQELSNCWWKIGGRMVKSKNFFIIWNFEKKRWRFAKNSCYKNGVLKI